MQNVALVIGVLGVMMGVFWVLHTCLNEMGCTEFCARCGYCSNQYEKCLGHNRDRRRRERACQNCVRRRNITSNEYASNNNMKPERRSSAWKSARNYANLPGPSHVNSPLRLWVHANKVHIRPVVDTPPADNGVQLGEQELIPPHRRSRSNSPVASCSRDTPNSYVVADMPPRPTTANRGSCKPPTFNIRSVWDSDSEEEEERMIPVHIS